jgi:putative lipoic acid-binding regulatory protein
VKNLNFDKNPFESNGEKEQVNFPVTYDLKVIFNTDEEINIQQRNLELVLEDSGVTHEFVKSRHSKKGNFVSLTMNITLVDMEQMKYLYHRLKLLPGIKFAV